MKKIINEVNGFQIANSLEIDYSLVKTAVEGLVSIGVISTPPTCVVEFDIGSEVCYNFVGEEGREQGIIVAASLKPLLIYEAVKCWEFKETESMIKECDVKEALVDAWFDGNSTSRHHPNLHGSASKFARDAIEEIRAK